jgi:hypothetical protein
MKEKIPSFNTPNNNFFDASHVNLTFSVPPPPKQFFDQESKSS